MQIQRELKDLLGTLVSFSYSRRVSEKLTKNVAITQKINSGNNSKVIWSTWVKGEGREGTDEEWLVAKMSSSASSDTRFYYQTKMY